MGLSTGEKCSNCGSDNWIGIDNDTEYIEICEDCNNQHSYSKSTFTKVFFCKKCKGRSGRLLDTKGEISIRCNNCGWTLKVKPKLANTVSHRTENTINNKYIQNDLIVRCPKCNSTQITTGTRGFSLITGFIGANQTMNRCAKCGHAWKP